ncbi:MAG: ABC transporter ATP-binding protein [Pseudomonadota bacterium]
MTATVPLVELHDVKKTFGDFVALDGISLSIRQGEFFSVLGPSGCGKSTILRLIAGLEQADSGSLSIGGNSMDKVPAYRRPCNMVFQNYAIFPHLNVADNVRYGLRNLELPKPEREQRVSDMLQAVRLGGLEARRPDQLSGGQRQRVALARALVRHPKVLLLDEPLGALDKNLREQMQYELRELQQSVGITFVLVTHDQEEALSMSDRIAVMRSGRILQIASPLEIYERPSCSQVAAFIGDMNFVAAVTDELSPDGRAAVSVAGFGRIEFDAALSAETPGLTHTVAVRPERLQLSPEPSASADFCVCGTVVSASYWGDQSQLKVAVDGCETPLVVALRNFVGAQGGLPARGERVWLSVQRDALLRFAD